MGFWDVLREISVFHGMLGTLLCYKLPLYLISMMIKSPQKFKKKKKKKSPQELKKKKEEREKSPEVFFFF